MKETFYFSHDYNAIQDPKLMAMLNYCGLSGVGMYWILIELLHQQPDNKLLYSSFEDYIEFYGRIDGDNEQVLNKIKQMLITTKLFVKEGDYIFSKRVLENKKQREEISEKRSFAGKKSAEARRLTNVEQKLTSVEQGKERKGKEKKVNNKIKEREEEKSSSAPSETAKKFFNSQDEQHRVIELLEAKGFNKAIVIREINKFISYWTEPNKSGSKERYEMERTFEVGRRLATWFSRVKEFSGQSNKGKEIIF